MNIFTMLSSSRGSKKLTIGNVIKFSNYKSSVLHTELRVSTLVLFIYSVAILRSKNYMANKVSYRAGEGALEYFPPPPPPQHFEIQYDYNWRASEASETLSGLFNLESRIYILCIYSTCKFCSYNP